MTAVAVDTNLLLLLIVGRTRRDFVRQHKRLTAYSERDFDLLARMMGEAEKLVATPNVLTEVNNLLLQGVREPLRAALISTLVDFTKVTDERYHPCRLAVQNNFMPKLGLTDTTWLCVLDRDLPLVTDDGELAAIAVSNGLTVVDFRQMQANYL